MVPPARFDHLAFQGALEAVLFAHTHDDDSEGRILRALELTQGSMDLHACVDQLEGETLDDARRCAWHTLWRACAGDDVSHLMWRVLDELQHACRDESHAFRLSIAELGRPCRTPAEGSGPPSPSPSKSKSKPTLRDRRTLRLVE